MKNTLICTRGSNIGLQHRKCLLGLSNIQTDRKKIALRKISQLFDQTFETFLITAFIY